MFIKINWIVMAFTTTSFFLSVITYSAPTISVEKASYGDSFLYSRYSDVTTSIQKQCDNNENCTISANNSSFSEGDPKKGFFKELIIHYKCIDNSSQPSSISSIKKVTIAEYATGSLSCNKNTSTFYADPKAFKRAVTKYAYITSGGVILGFTMYSVLKKYCNAHDNT